MSKSWEIQTNKSIFGTRKYNGEFIFYKILNDKNIREIEGYNIIKDLYRVPKRILYYDNIIYYEYKKELINNTLHDYLYNKLNRNINFKKVFESYKANIKKGKLLNEKLTKNRNFFGGRTNKLDYYLKEDEFNKEYIINNEKYNIKEILKEIKRNLNSTKKLFCFISQGDPTDTNISVKGLYTDFENAGYNSLVGEIAIAFASFCTHGCYFYPKYHPQTYKMRPKILKKYNKYGGKIKYNQKTISYIFKIPQKNKKLMYNFLKIIDESISTEVREEISKYLKYYICMRMLTPMDISKMDYEDKMRIIALVIKFYNELNSLEDLLNYLE
jgi:hypothetical protein